MITDGVLIEPGPALLAGLPGGPGLVEHRRRVGPLRRVGGEDVVRVAEAAGLRGRGGAAFPFARKLRTVLDQGRSHPVVVVNLSEGERLSAKDQALALVAPHLILDGALSVARAIGARRVHLALPGERPAVRRSMVTALEQRDDAGAVRCHVSSPRFVAGQEQAVLELVSGRENLPVTAWRPAAASGIGGRPTLLSNAETWAQLGFLLQLGLTAYRRLGTFDEPGTTLLTISGPGRPRQVREAEYGTSLGAIVPELGSAIVGDLVLVGGFHGSWVPREVLARNPLSVDGLRSLGCPLGAGVVHLLALGQCPVRRTSEILRILAGESAGRCGPCRLGLPALSAAVDSLTAGRSDHAEVERLAALVTGRGACAHPDGTVRLVRSLLCVAPGEVAAHARGLCTVTGRPACQVRPTPPEDW
jgi:NADH:ubiquinone oxidoreductase subunit F (NADH-binding)